MIINEKEIKFRYTIRAKLKVASLCPGNKSVNLAQLFEGSDKEVIDTLGKIGMILNSEYEMNRRKEQGKSYDPEEDYSLFSLDDVYDMSESEMTQLESELTNVMYADQMQTIQTKAGKKTRKLKASNSTSHGTSSTEE